MAITPETVQRVTTVPDPTVLTTAALQREVGALREVIDAKLDGLKEVLEARLDGMDKAITLLQVTTDRQPAEVDKKLYSLRTLHEEKFSSIQTQFVERDVRTEQSAKDSKVAVDAALSAAKEAVGEQNKSSALAIAKSETATTKQIDQQGVLLATGNSALNDKIDDIKERLTRIEGEGRGVKVTTDSNIAQKDSSAAQTSNVVSVISAIIAVGAVIMSIVMAFRGT